MDLQAKERRQERGLYVHVPFCAATCDFCGFYQKKPHGDDFERYLEGIHREVEFYGERMEGCSTVFWGGGTPGLLGPREMGGLAESIRPLLKAGGPDEWSVEMAPAFVTGRKLEALAAAGVNRISLGVQSFSEVTLEGLGRQHTRGQIFRAVERVRAAGIRNLNLDLIFGIPGQSVEAWRDDLKEAIDLEPEHISTYCLTLEEDTALWLRLSKGRAELDPDREAAFYETAWALLESHGFEQYEISNFSRPGAACRHNLNTWTMQEWLGLGPAAASQFGGWRYANIPDLEMWLEGLEKGELAWVERTEAGAALLAQDALIFGIRMNRGVDLERWSRRFGMVFSPVLEDRLAEWRDEGLVEANATDRLALTAKGRLLADRLGSELLELPLLPRDPMAVQDAFSR